MDTRSPEPLRPSMNRQQRRALLVAGAVVAILVPLMLVSRPSGPPEASPRVAASATAPAATGASPAPSSPPEPWGPLALEPFDPVADLAPATTDEAGVAPGTTFALRSLTAASAIELAGRLQVVPSTDLRVAAGSDPRTATLTPTTALQPGTMYRFALRSEEGALQGTWAYRVRGPVRVTGTLPGNATTDVPVATGIEVTFDQEDVADLAGYFSIEPAVAGRFERHGRTQVFIPSTLEPRTLYTVTVRAGLPRTGTDLRLEQPVTFRFETAGERPAVVRWIVGRDALEASPSEPPVLGIVARTNDDGEGDPTPIPTTAAVKAYRYPSETAAATALQDFLQGPRWMEFSGPVLDTTGLKLEVEFTAQLEELPDPWSDQGKYRALRFPARLPVGSYAVQIAGDVPAYAFLQVTRVSAWVAVLTDRTVLWVNDVVSRGAVAGATVALPGGDPFGMSREDGVLIARTPSALLPAAVSDEEKPAPPILVVRSGASRLLVAFDAASEDGVYRGEWWEEWNSGDETYWSLLHTDRWQYRTTDTVATWGFLQSRDGDTTPNEVEIRIVPAGSSSRGSAPALASAKVPVDAVGVYSATVAIDRAPLGSYHLVTVVGGRVVATRSIQVTVIHKPEYQLEVTLDHRAVILGTTVQATASASFFDGTPVPGRELSLSDDSDDDQRFGPTGSDGQATTSWVTIWPEWMESDGDPRSMAIGVSPTGAESGDIWGGSDVLIFPAAEHIAAGGSVAGGRLHVTGTLRTIDLPAVERALAAGFWNGEVAGPVIAGRTVTVRVTELVPVRTKIGTRYDYIEKVVVPIYSYRIERKTLPSTTIVSGTDGRLVLDIAVPSSDHQYEAALATEDAGHRPVVRTITVGREFVGQQWDVVNFEAEPGTPVGGQLYDVGDVIDWTMSSQSKPLPADAPNRYLYIVAQRGLVRVSTTDSPRFRRTFAAADAPGIFVMGVRFTGATYAPKAAAWANFDPEARRISVTITADRPSYRPGDDIGLTVRTVDRRGDPVAADVVLQAVDEKLYAMGAAATTDPLLALYERVDSGIVRLTSTHQVPTASGGEGEGGDGGGGEPRTDFRDMLAFVRLRTNASGVATTVIRASDDLTAWHVSASAMTAGLEAGVGELQVRVGLPVFASVTVADAYLDSDRPAIQLRAFGTDLRPGDPVTFTVSSSTLGLAATTVTAKAFEAAWVTLPALHVGRPSLDVRVVATTRLDSAGKPISDHLIVPFDVIDSRVTVHRAAYGQVGAATPPVPGESAATYTFTDAGRGRYLATLLDLVGSASVRLDRQLAAGMARAMLVEAFGRAPDSLPPSTFDLSRYEIDGPLSPDSGALSEWQGYGIPLVPYGGPDSRLATRIVIDDPAFERAGDLRWMLGLMRDDASLPRDLRIAAIAALASLGEPVLADVTALRGEPDLTQMESIHLGLAAAALGDEATAREIEQALLTAHGQRLGAWVRLGGASTGDDPSELTALLALLAARIGDPLAPAMLEYVLAHPSTETSHDLEAAATVAALLERIPAVPTSFAYTVDGTRTVVELAAGQAVTIALTAPQAAGLRLERLSGDVGVTVAWREAADLAALELDPTIGLTRTVQATVPTEQLVVVTLVATFETAALDAPCYAVTEHVPSGLVPLAGPVGVDDSGTINWPSEVAGQEVRFCVSRNPKHRLGVVTLRYVARVVSTGTFTWEPALMHLDGAPEVVTIAGGGSVRVGG